MNKLANIIEPVLAGVGIWHIIEKILHHVL